MTDKQKDTVIDLLFEIYEAGAQHKTIDLTGYLNDITKELSLESEENSMTFTKEDIIEFCYQYYTDLTTLKSEVGQDLEEWINQNKK